MSREVTDGRPVAVISRGEAKLWVVVFIAILGLQLAAITSQSLTGDGALHLLAGHQALRYGEDTLNWEHPPLVKMLAAAPSLFGAPLAVRLDADQGLETVPEIHAEPSRIRRLTRHGRLILLVTLTVPFLLLCADLGSRVAGRRAGFVLAATLGLAFSTVPNLSILQTDTACALAAAGSAATGLRLLRSPDWRWALVLGILLGVGLAGKYSAVLLVPGAIAAVVLAPTSRRARAGLLATMLAAALAVPWATISIADRHADEESRLETLRQQVRGRSTMVVHGEMVPWLDQFEALQRVSPAAARWTVGFFGIAVQNRIGIYPSFAFGHLDPDGFWWYFPALFLVKTPLAVLVVLGIALGASRRQNLRCRQVTVLLALAVPYLVAALASSYNIGYRHLLPILPFVMLPVAVWLGRRPRYALGLCLLLGIESLALAPLWMSATNTWWLGSRNPTRFAFSAGNLEYRQNLAVLAAELEERGITRIGMLYPGTPIEVTRAWIPGAFQVGPDGRWEEGWYAVNVLVEQLVPPLLERGPNDPELRPGTHAQAAAVAGVWERIRRGEDHGYVAATFHLYRLSSPND